MGGAVLSSAGVRGGDQSIEPSADFIASAQATTNKAEALENLLQSSCQKSWAATVGAPELLEDFQERISEALSSVNRPQLATQTITTALKSTFASFLSRHTRSAREGMFKLVKATNTSITAVGTKFRDAIVSASQQANLDPAALSEMHATEQTLIDQGICRQRPVAASSPKSAAGLNLLDGLKSFFFRHDAAPTAALPESAAVERLRKNQMQLEHSANFEIELLGACDRAGNRIGSGRFHQELELIDLATLAGQAAAKRLLHNYSDLLMNHYDIFRATQRAKRDFERSLGMPQADEPAAPRDFEVSVLELRAILQSKGVNF